MKEVINIKLKDVRELWMSCSIKTTQKFLKRYYELNRSYNLLGVFKLDAKSLTKYKQNNKKIFEILDFFCEKEILFCEPSEKRVYPNSQIYINDMQRLLSVPNQSNKQCNKNSKDELC